MRDSLIPTPPDVMTPWRAAILEALPNIDVGVKRPADVTNLDRPFVRLVNLGGRWDWVQFWYPTFVTETFAPDPYVAHQIDATVSRVTRELAGMGGKPGQSPGWYITSSRLESQGADATIDGIPVVTTRALLCVQAWPITE